MTTKPVYLLVASAFMDESFLTTLFAPICTLLATTDCTFVLAAGNDTEEFVSILLRAGVDRSRITVYAPHQYDPRCETAILPNASVEQLLNSARGAATHAILPRLAHNGGTPTIRVSPILRGAPDMAVTDAEVAETQREMQFSASKKYSASFAVELWACQKVPRGQRRKEDLLSLLSEALDE